MRNFLFKCNPEPVAYCISGGKPPQRVNFVELLTKLLCDNIPDFWRLWQSYLSGKLLKEVKNILLSEITRYACVTLVRTSFGTRFYSCFYTEELFSLDKTSYV